MSSIYDKITIRPLENLSVKEVKKKTVTKVEFLRMYSEIARQETDEEIQAFFDAFKI